MIILIILVINCEVDQERPLHVLAKVPPLARMPATTTTTTTTNNNNNDNNNDDSNNNYNDNSNNNNNNSNNNTAITNNMIKNANQSGRSMSWQRLRP